jgi:hypothetical protein
LPPICDYVLFYRGNYNIFPDNTFMQNEPKVKYAKINVSSYEISRYAHMGHLVIQINKPNSNPNKPNLPKGQKMLEFTPKKHYLGL